MTDTIATHICNINEKFIGIFVALPLGKIVCIIIAMTNT